MIIKKLEIGYGGAMTPNYEIVKNGRELVYRCGQGFPADEIIRVPAPLEWLEFGHAVMSLLKSWKKEYFNESKHGIQWKVNIETSEGFFYSCGSNEFPENFHAFVHHCRNIVRCSDFASDFHGTSVRATRLFPLNPFNRKILRLLKDQGKSIVQLADFLEYEAGLVREQLRSAETFPHDDLLRICAFLNELPADFLFETSPEPYSAVVKDVQESSASIRRRSRQIQRLLIDHFDNTFAQN